MKKRNLIFIVISIVLLLAIADGMIFLFGFYIPKQAKDDEMQCK